MPTFCGEGYFGGELKKKAAVAFIHVILGSFVEKETEESLRVISDETSVQC